MVRRLVVCVLGVAGVFGGGVAWGASALPEAMSGVPAGAGVVVGVRSLGETDRRSEDLLEAAGMTDLPTFRQALRVLGLREGVDLDRGGAVGVFPAGAEGGVAVGVGDDAARVDVAIVLAVSEYASFAGGLGVRGEALGGTGRTSFEGVALFLREIGGGYAGIATTAALVEAMAVPAGAGAGLVGRAGEVVREADVVIVAEPAALLGWWGVGVGGDGFGAAAAAGLAPVLMQTERVVGGVRVTPRGVVGRFVGELRDGSELGGALAAGGGGGGAGDVLAGLPEGSRGGGWLVAFGVDAAHPLAGDVLGRVGLDVPGVDAVSGALYAGGETVDGGAAVSSGLLTWRGAGADAGAEAMEAFWGRSSEWLIPVERGGGVGAAGVEGWRADVGGLVPGGLGRWLGVGVDGALAGVAGARGAAGAAATDPGLVSGVLSGDEAGGLARDRIVRAARRLLPADRFLEVQVNAKSFIGLAGLAARARGLTLENPARYPPLALALSSGAGEIEAALFVPAPAVQNVFELRGVIGEWFGGDGG